MAVVRLLRAPRSLGYANRFLSSTGGPKNPRESKSAKDWKKFGRKRGGPTPRPPRPFDVRKPLLNPDWLPGDWGCEECGAHNPGGRKSCRLCGAQITVKAIENSRLKVEKWKCIACGWSNDQTRINCYSCRAPKEYPSESLVNKASWYCQRCKVYNSIREDSCYVCKRHHTDCAKDSQMGIEKPQLKVKFQAGDWICSNCKAHNFRGNEKCHKCDKKKEKREVFESTPREGDWICPNCATANFAQRKLCFDCGIKRPTNVLRIQPEVADIGSWECPKCNLRNSKFSKICVSCKFEPTGKAREELMAIAKETQGPGKPLPVEKGLLRGRLRLFPPAEELFGPEFAVSDVSEQTNDPFRVKNIDPGVANSTWECYKCGSSNVGLDPCHVCYGKATGKSLE